MILPVLAYGSPVLRKPSEDIDGNYNGLKEMIDNMFETMYKAEGIGLSGPQVGYSIKLFVIDASPLEKDDETLKDFKKVFINAQIIEQAGEDWLYNEGCLSIPTIREDVKRKTRILLQYYDENFKFHKIYFEGIKARIILHEYDHLGGILFTDRILPLKNKLLKGKLQAISKGKVDVKYKMSFPDKRKK